MNALTLNQTEEKLAQRIQSEDSKRITIAGGVTFTDAEQVMQFARMMALGNIAIPDHLRGNVGACLAIVFQAVEWRMSPFSVANKSYSVNNRLAFESQMIQAVILQRAPIRGRFKVEYTGEGERRRCKVSAELADGTGTVEYESPEIGKITPKNSPLWKSDPDQQLFYFAGRSLCRRHFPDVILGVYDRDELEPARPGPRGGTAMALSDKLEHIAQQHPRPAEPQPIPQPIPPQGEPEEDDPTEDDGALRERARTALLNLGWGEAEKGEKALTAWLKSLVDLERQALTEEDVASLKAAAREATFPGDRA